VAASKRLADPPLTPVRGNARGDGMGRLVAPSVETRNPEIRGENDETNQYFHLPDRDGVRQR
jgi:hypothetical protein